MISWAKAFCIALSHANVGKNFNMDFLKDEDKIKIISNFEIFEYCAEKWEIWHMLCAYCLYAQRWQGWLYDQTQIKKVRNHGNPKNIILRARSFVSFEVTLVLLSEWWCKSRDEHTGYWFSHSQSLEIFSFHLSSLHNTL